MSRTVDPAAARPSGAEGSPDASGGPGATAAYVCPFCGLSEDHAAGAERAEGSPCPRCGMSDTPSTRKATKARIGPWHVRQVRNPWAPGMKWDTLVSLIKRGQVTANSVVRGPTTHQLWKRAAHVKGLSREFGVCYSCGEAIDPKASVCGQCNRLQEPPLSPDLLLEGRDGAPPVAPPRAPAALPEAPAATAATVKAATAQPAPAEVSSVEPATVEATTLNEPVAPQPMPTVSPAMTVPALADPSAPMPARELAGLHKSPGRGGNGHGRGGRPLEKVIGNTERPLNLPEAPATLEDGFRSPASPREREATPQRECEAAPRQNEERHEALLSAEELAAAFKLEFQPRPPRQRGSGGAMKIAAAVLLLAGSVACLLFVQPTLRERSVRWAGQQWESITSRNSATAPARPVGAVKSNDVKPRETTPSLAPTRTTGSPSNQNRSAPTTAPTKPPTLTATPMSAAPSVLTTPSPAAVSARNPAPPPAVKPVIPQPAAPTAKAIPAPAQSTAQAPTTPAQNPVAQPSAAQSSVAQVSDVRASAPQPPAAQPRVQAQPQTAAMTEKPAAKEAITPATLPSPAAAKAAEPKLIEPKVEPKVESKPPPAPPAPAVDPVDQARTLWRKAIDSEISGDFHEAVKCYEQIKKLPSDVQPEGIDVRLEQAKKQIKK